jgi:hypothetical protein
MGRRKSNTNAPSPLSIGFQLFHSSTTINGTSGDVVNSGTTAIGIGVFFEVCSKPPEETYCPKEDEIPNAFSPDAYTVGFKFLGYTKGADGSVCVSLGAGGGIPAGMEWDY